MDGQGSNSRLYKLKYFCQICNKQLKDKDGYNCHLNSNYHKQNIEIVADNPQYYISNYSKEFEAGYMDLLKRNYPVNWVSANKVYQEYISDKHSTHMNATKWSTLTGFIKYMETTGKVMVLEEEKDFKIKYIDNTPQAISDKNKLEKKKKDELMIEKIRERKLFEKIKKITELENKKHEIDEKIIKKIDNEIKKDEIKKNNENKPIEIKLEIDRSKLKPKENNLFSKLVSKKPTKKEENNLEKSQNSIKEKGISDLIFTNLQGRFENEDIFKKKTENLLKKKTQREKEKDEYEEIHQIKSKTGNINKTNNDINDDEEIIAENNYYFDKDLPWIDKNLIVKIKDSTLAGGEYFDLKATVIKVIDKYLAELKLLDSEIILQIDQEFLEPILPKVNSIVQVLYGEHKGKIGILREINQHGKYCIIDVSSDNFDNLINLDLNGVCKLEYPIDN